jgi:pimeloyl-ACP methyl ester carboxylesterase
MGAQGQLVSDGSVKHDTLNTRVVPIVVVPGVMGTRLNIDNSAFDWDPDDPAEMADWLKGSFRDTIRRRLHHKTKADVLTSLQYRFSIVPKLLNSPTVDPRDDLKGKTRLEDIATLHLNPRPSRGRQSHLLKMLEARGWGGMVWTFYRSILISLSEELNKGPGTSERHPVYGFGYDWRQSCADTGQKMVERIKEILKLHPGATQVIVVTHSMGGLVTRGALLKGGEPLIGGVVHCVMPADGAVVAYRRMLTGALTLFGDEPEPLDDIMGGTKTEYFITQSGLRGPTELLPHDVYPDPWLRLPANLSNKDFPDIFDAYSKDVAPGFTPKEEPRRRGLTLEQQCVPEMKARLSEARTFTRSIAGKFHPKTFVMFGGENVTDVEFDWTKGQVDDDRTKMAPMVIRREKEGDGTVPSPSARFTGGPRRLPESFPVTHAECFASKDFTAKVIGHVNDLLATM